MAEFLTGNPRCSICAGHHPVTANCFLSTNWIPLEKTPMADETSEALRRRAEAAEAEVDRLKGVLGEEERACEKAIITATKAEQEAAEARAEVERLRQVLTTLATETSISQEERKYHARSALEAKP